MIYDPKDKVEMLRLFKLANASSDDCNSIYSLLKKYVRPNAPMYNTGCGCKTDISAYWIQLRDWYGENNWRFGQ